MCPVLIRNDEYLTSSVDTQFSFTPISENETLKIIKNLKNKCSYGVDGISNVLLKSISNEIVKPLTLIINQSLETGIFPNAFKTSKVVPIYKKGDKANLSNYRPISILPTISKIFERVIHIQLYDYFCKNNLLCEQQYWFRSKHSTELATIKLVDYLLKNMDDNHIPGAIYLDLSKACDTLNFDILLSKLKFYGVVGTPLKLLDNYLRNRQQFVEFKNKNSDLQEILTGIPQGSILGPLFFSIYINDLIKSTDKFKYLMYADNTTLYFNLEDFDSVTMNDDINSCLDKINVWLKLNKLTVNVSKTKFMIFHKRRDVPDLNLSLNNINIESVSHFNFLGIILDTALSWKYHTNMIAIKISKVIGILHKLKYIFPQNILLTIYKSLILPHLNYGLLLWGVHLQDISVLQKKAIRVVTNNTYKSHTEPIFKEYGLLNVNDMFLLNKLKFLHKLYHNNLPIYFEGYWEHLTKTKLEYNLRSRMLPVPINMFIGYVNKLRSNFGKMQLSTLISLFKSYCCSFYGSHLWKFNSSGFDKCCKSWNIAVRILLGLPFNAHVYLLSPLVGQLGMREQLYVRNFRFLWNAFRLQNHIVYTCMDMALDNSNTCIGYKLAFYRYMYSIDIYRTINFSIKQLSGSNINDEQIAIVNNLSTLLSVRSGNNYINDFTLIEVNDLIIFLSTM